MRMEVELPDDFRCPISLEVMTDPVILPSGHTFDRASIQRWLDSGNRTCPVTNLPLPPSPSLIPNHALRSLISSFLAQRPTTIDAAAGNRDALLLPPISFPSDAPTLAAVLRLAQRGGPNSRRLVADSGAASVLLRHAAAPDRPDLQDLSLRALLHLTLDGDDARLGLVAEGALDPVVAALRGGPAAALAATLLTSLAVVDVNKATIGAHPAAIPLLAALLRYGDGRERREAATALYELCKFAENRRRTVRAGALLPLVRLTREGSERAVRILGLLAKCREGKEEMRKLIGFINVLSEVLRAGSPRGIEHALLVLNYLCSDSREMAFTAIKEGILDLCSVLAGDMNPNIGKNAMELVLRLEKEQFGGYS
ncbi:U-box domain-containing protein [Musa troglodytarum]|uniref:RING-type E3 ubiquitin transferase n=1 Tax=Musa troglodytarum TaxID=320322 RepID=A0A9E7I8J8_9LILI|nr:U-box domain-containing protein [Musa troglodytarum]